MDQLNILILPTRLFEKLNLNYINPSTFFTGHQQTISTPRIACRYSCSKCCPSVVGNAIAASGHSRAGKTSRRSNCSTVIIAYFQYNFNQNHYHFYSIRSQSMRQHHFNNNATHGNDLEPPNLTNPRRVKKLTKFFGEDPPLMRLFLKNLGYEVCLISIKISIKITSINIRNRNTPISSKRSVLAWSSCRTLAKNDYRSWAYHSVLGYVFYKKRRFHCAKILRFALSDVFLASFPANNCQRYSFHVDHNQRI